MSIEQIIGLINFDLLSNLAGVAGLCLSLFLAVSEFLKDRQKFEFSVLDYTDVRYVRDVTQFFVSIVNKSSAPLVITEVAFHGTICELEPKEVRSGSPARAAGTTPRFPLCVPARSAQFVYLEFVDCEHSPLVADTWVTFQIQTIDQRELRTVLLGSTSHYLHKRN